MKLKGRIIKRVLSAVMAAAMCAAFASCGKKSDETVKSEHIPVIIVPDVCGTEIVTDSFTWPLTGIDGDITMDEVKQYVDDFALDPVGGVKSAVTVKDASPLSSIAGDEPVGTNGKYTALCRALAEKIGEDNVWFFGYDWRIDCRRTAEELSKYISRVKKKCGAKTVNVVAHGMGGLIVGEYLAYHRSDNSIGRIVTCGVPFLGIKNAQDRLSQPVKDAIRSRFDDLADTDANLYAMYAVVYSTFRSFPTVFELSYYSDYLALGVIFNNGDLRDNATAAQSQAYAHYNAVTVKLSAVFANNEMLNIVGVEKETAGEKGEIPESGDGLVTLNSATGGGAFNKNGEKYAVKKCELYHDELIYDGAAVESIINHVVENND